MQKIEITCALCNNNFFKSKNLYKKEIIKEPNTVFFCSVDCKRKYKIKINKSYVFGYFINRALYRVRHDKKYNNVCDLTEEYLKQVWDSQNGRCSISNIEMNLPINSTIGFGENKKSPYNASLDRIDNSKSYVKENVRFICLLANYARCSFEDSDLIEFCEKVSDFNN